MALSTILAPVTVSLAGVPMLRASPNITPKKSAPVAGAAVKVIVLPETVYADIGSCKIPPTEINNVVSFGGVTLTLPT
jgi:hypothetical protein